MLFSSFNNAPSHVMIFLFIISRKGTKMLAPLMLLNLVIKSATKYVKTWQTWLKVGLENAGSAVCRYH